MPVDNRNLVIINDMSRYPDYNLYFFHQGELGVHIPCKPTHPNVSVSLIHVDQLNKEPNFEVKRNRKIQTFHQINKTKNKSIGCASRSAFQLVAGTRTRTDTKKSDDQ